MSSRTSFRVRFGDIDPAGIVYYPKLVDYTHHAVEDFFERVGVDYAELIECHGLGLPTIRLEMDFLRPLRYGDRVEIVSTVEKLGRTSVIWRHELHRAGEVPDAEGETADAASTPRVVARVVSVCVRLADLEKQPIPDWLRSKLEEASAR